MPEKNFTNKRLILIGVGLLIFVLVGMFGNYSPVPLNPKLPSEVTNVIQYVGLSEGDLLNAIRKYFPNKKNTVSSQEETHRVTRIIDGDTIEIDGATTVRYIGIDAPEKYSNITKAECWNEEAIKNNSDLVLGKEIRLEKDVSDTDQYGRLLGYVFVDEVFVNEELVRSGSAHAKTYPPDTREDDMLASAELEAKANKAGLWGACN